MGRGLRRIGADFPEPSGIVLDPSTATDADDEGNLKGLMDGLTAQYLESDAPNPSQQVLDEMLAGVTRVRVIDDGAALGEALGNDVLLASADPESLRGLGH